MVAFFVPLLKEKRCYPEQSIFSEKHWSGFDRARGIVVPNLIGNRNALVRFVGCIKIPACAYRVDTSLWISQPCIDALKYLIPIQRVVIPGCRLLS